VRKVESRDVVAVWAMSLFPWSQSDARFGNRVARRVRVLAGIYLDRHWRLLLPTATPQITSDSSEYMASQRRAPSEKTLSEAKGGPPADSLISDTTPAVSA
jgi:hypothetical protein